MAYDGFSQAMKRRVWVYLHEQGAVKIMPAYIRTLEEFKRPEVIAAWHIDFSRPAEAWGLAVESAALWCSPRSTRLLELDHSLTHDKAVEYAKRTGVSLTAVRHGWKAACAEWASGPVGEHDTALLAMADLARHLGLREGVPMGTPEAPRFRQLVARHNRDKPMKA